MLDSPTRHQAGGEYGASIIDAIDQCRVMILIFSSSANDSSQIHREIERAVSKGVPIVPVRIEEVLPTKSMEYFLGAIHWLDALTPPIEKHLHHLAETVKAILQVDVRARGAPVHNHAYKSSAETPGQEPDRSAARYRAARMSAVEGSSISKNRVQMSWLLPAIGGGICVALLSSGVWLYHSRVHIPTTDQSKPSPASIPVNVAASRDIWTPNLRWRMGVQSRRW
jgi:hypothetical protein